MFEPNAKQDTNREPLEELAEEFIEAHRLGDQPSVEAYAIAHPDFASQIRDLFPTLLMMEDVPCSKTDLFDFSPQEGEELMDRDFGDFEIVREIGRGGMGVVYEAHQQSLGRRVALKILAPGYVSSSKQIQRFEREARAAARLHHTNIVPVFGFGQHEETHFYVMQYIAAQSLDAIVAQASSTHLPLPNSTSVDSALSDELPYSEFHALEDSDPLLSENDALPNPAKSESNNLPSPPLAKVDVNAWREDWRRIAEAMVQVADALSYAHRHGVLHRDIKPSNLLLDSEGTIWVTDFGLAKLTEQADITESGDTLGTLRYMAPEQLLGQADTRSDVYSLGLTLYEMLVLRPAFNESDRGRLLKQFADGTPPPPPRSLCATLPRDLETIVLKAITREPERRYASADALADDLRRFIEDRPILARRVSPVERLWRWGRRNPVVSSLSAIALSLVLVIAVVSAMSHVALRESHDQVQDEQALADAARAQGDIERRRADEEKIRAEDTFHMAIAAFDSIFDSVSGGLSGDPHVAESAEQFDPLAARPIVSDEVADMLQVMLIFYEEFALFNSNNPQLREDMIDAHRFVGDIQQQLGNSEESESAYLRALSLLEAGSPDGAEASELNLDIASVHLELGRVLHTTARFDEADAQYAKAEARLATCLESAASDAAKYQLAHVYKQRGDVARTVGDPTQAFTFYQNSAELAHGLVEAHPDSPLHKYLLAHIHRYRPIRGPGKQFEGLQQAIDLLTELSEAYPEVSRYQFDLSETYASAWNEGWRPHPHHHPNEESLAFIEAWLREAVLISEELIDKYPGIPEYEASRVHAVRKLGDLLAVKGEHAQAEIILREAVQSQSELADRFPEIPLFQMDLAKTEWVLGNVLFQSDKPAEAHVLLSNAIQRQEYFLLLAPQYRAGHYLLSKIWMLMAEVHIAEGDEEGAKAARAAAIASEEKVRKNLAEAISLSGEELSQLLGHPHFRGHRHEEERPHHPRHNDDHRPPHQGDHPGAHQKQDQAIPTEEAEGESQPLPDESI